MNYNYRLWKKFLNKRVYGWDLHKRDGNGDNKVVRFIRGVFITEYKENDGKQQSLPVITNGTNLQIYTAMKNKNSVKAFILARKICRMDSKYKLNIGYIIKPLRHE